MKRVAHKTENNQISIKKKSGGGRNYVKKGGNGGARPGAGRKPAATTRKTRAIADQLATDGELTPLEFMLQTMRETPDELRKQHKEGVIDTAEFVLRLKDLIDRRYAAAKDAAPYIHPRLASVEAKVEDNSHEKWLALMDEAGL